MKNSIGLLNPLLQYPAFSKHCLSTTALLLRSYTSSLVATAVFFNGPQCPMVPLSWYLVLGGEGIISDPKSVQMFLFDFSVSQCWPDIHSPFSHDRLTCLQRRLTLMLPKQCSPVSMFSNTLLPPMSAPFSASWESICLSWDFSNSIISAGSSCSRVDRLHPHCVCSPSSLPIALWQ